MAYRLTYTSTRPDTSADWYFFYETADAGFETNATHFRNWLDARSDVTVTLTVAEDNLSFKWELDFADETAYDAFVVDRTAYLPLLLTMALPIYRKQLTWITYLLTV